MDDNPAIHDDFRRILDHQERSEQLTLDELENSIFGASEPPQNSLPTYQIESALGGTEAVSKVSQAVRQREPFSLCFIEMRIAPGMSGIDAIEQMWQIAPDLQVVACTAYSEYSWNSLVNRLGWSDRLLVLKKPFDKMEVSQMALALCVKHQLEQMARLKTEDLRTMVARRTLELEKEIQRRQQVEAMLRSNPNQFYDAGEVDSATGLLNRRAILDRIKLIARDADENQIQYSILIVDIDCLEDVNRQFGYVAGDLVLKNVAQRLRETLRPSDVIGRFGGEEFMIGLRNCSEESAVLVAERLRKRVANSVIAVDGKDLKITVSVGVATRDPNVHAVTEKVLECADQALGSAKDKGRNRVESQRLFANAP